MSDQSHSLTRPLRRGQVLIFRVLAALLVLAMGLFGGQLLVTGWAGVAPDGSSEVQQISWGMAEGLLLAVALAAQLPRPQLGAPAMLVAASVIAAQLVTVFATLTFDSFALIVVALGIVLITIHPARPQVLRPTLVPDRLALYVTVPASFGLLAWGVTSVVQHYGAPEGHTGYIGAAIAGFALAATLLVAALRPQASLLPTAFAAISSAVLGAVWIIHPRAASSLGVVGGLVALTVAVSLVGRMLTARGLRVAESAVP
jgi:hypothetical protein